MPSRLLMTFVLLAAGLPAAGQEREVELYRLPRSGTETTPGTYRDMAAQGIGEAHTQVGEIATTKVEKLSRMDRAGSTRRQRQAQHRQLTELKRSAEQLGKNVFVKGLGIVNTLSDSPATIAGHLSVGNYESASVATLDETVKGLSATGGAALGAGVGAKVGVWFGPKGMMLGAGVGAVAGAVVATLGYNAYASPAVTGSAEAAIESLQTPPQIQAWRNRQEHLIARAMREKERECYLVAAPLGRGEVLRAAPIASGQVPAQPPATTPETPQVVQWEPDWLYQGVWLPPKYIPAGYRHYDDAPAFRGDPWHGHNISQSLWYPIPLRKKHGQPSSSSTEHPYTVYIDGMTVFKSVPLAQKTLQQWLSFASNNVRVPVGDEAYGDSADGSIFKEYTSDRGVFRRDAQIRYIRVGRIVFGLRIVASRVIDFDPSAGSRDFVAHETPSGADVMRVIQLFVAQVRQYAKDKHWLHD